MSKIKLMSVEKQLKLKVGDLVVLNGITRPGVVKDVDLLDQELPVLVEFFYNDSSKSKTLWGHPPIIRRYPRVGEKVVVNGNSGGNIGGNHTFDTGSAGVVGEVHEDSRFLSVLANGYTQTVWEKDVKRIKKSKEKAA